MNDCFVFPKSMVNPKIGIKLNYCFVSPQKPEATHKHEFIEISYVLSGCGTEIINGQEYPLEQGSLSVLKLRDTHSYNSKNHSKMVLMNLLILPEIAEKNEHLKRLADGDTLQGCNPFRIPPNFISEFESVLFTMMKEHNNKNDFYDQILPHYLDIMLLYIERYVAQKPDKSFNEILYHLESRIYNNWDCSLKALAKNYNYNPNYFSTLFKKLTGMKYSEYLDRKRVDIAKNKILYTQDSIDDVCHSSGFKEKKHFYKVFKKYVGTTPGQYRHQQINRSSMTAERALDFSFFNPDYDNVIIEKDVKDHSKKK